MFYKLLASALTLSISFPVAQGQDLDWKPGEEIGLAVDLGRGRLDLMVGEENGAVLYYRARTFPGSTLEMARITRLRNDTLVRYQILRHPPKQQLQPLHMSRRVILI